jgi:hypothetical protein
VAMRNQTHKPGVGFTERLEAVVGSGGSAAGLAIQDQPASAPGAVMVAGQLSGVTDWAVIAIELDAAG